MDASEYHRRRRFARTPFGDIAFVERGSGPVAVFLHGYPLNGYQWRDIIERLSDAGRCIVLDLMGAGYTRTALDQAVSYPAQALMIDSFLDALGIDQIDLVGNDSGSAVSQIFAARHANRLRSLTLTNSVVHDHWPPPSLVWLVEAARAGTYKTRLKQMLANLDQFRANLGHVFERPDRLTDETLQAYYQPFVASDVAERNLERFITSIDARHTVEIEGLLKELHVPTLIIWGTGDNIFPLKWAYWLKTTIPGAREVIELPGAKLWFPEEYPEFVSEKLRAHWTRVTLEADALSITDIGPTSSDGAR
jgi:pimeloyl-ACP methyl ester carboxylesterase